ncbi:MAG: hypothetical protein R2713_11325 [Ilumatobacteraceae bacterium]
MSQDPHLFHDTIGANLRHEPDATDAELTKPAAGTHPRPPSCKPLPDGHDTVVGERGYRMSGSRQRLAIARLLLKNLGDHDPRRGDEPPRQRERGTRAGRFEHRAAARPHGDRHRPPAHHHPRMP